MSREPYKKTRGISFNNNNCYYYNNNNDNNNMFILVINKIKIKIKKKDPII